MLTASNDALLKMRSLARGEYLFFTEISQEDVLKVPEGIICHSDLG